MSDAEMEIRIPDCHLALLARLFRDVVAVLNKYQYTYWIDGGTLLGAVRHKGQIPWDDDVDLGIKEKDYPKIRASLGRELGPAGYGLEDHGTLMKVFIPGQWISDGIRVIGTPTLDIFSWKEFNNNGEISYQLADPEHRRRWPHCRYTKNELFPLKNYPFDSKHFLVKGPKIPYKYLTNMYPGWRDEAVIEIRKPENRNKAETIKMSLEAALNS